MSGAPDRKAALHRALRVTVAASAGFYAYLYGLDKPVMALYALFGPVALGGLASIPGSGRQRATVILKSLPVGLLLVTLGTTLAVTTWAAVLGMLVIGFCLAFAAVAGPRAAGAGPGLQLFYILACVPPYAPDTLGLRLTGLTTGLLALAACEFFLLPAPAAAPYRARLAEALAIAAGAAADPSAVSPGGLRDAGRRLRLSDVPEAERPAGPGRRDRALSQAGSATRRLLEQLAHFADALAHAPRTGGASGTGGAGGTGGTGGAAVESSATERAQAASDALLAQVSALCGATAVALRDGRMPPKPGPLHDAVVDFQTLRLDQATGPPDAVPPVRVLRRQSAVLGIAESARIMETATQVGADGRRQTEPVPPPELFWYAGRSTAQLWAKRLFGHMTLRSVQFQNAVRTALGLGAARLVAGSFDLPHGFWVMLAVLTLGRTTTVGQTWGTVRKVLAGNLVGAVVAGALLIAFGKHTEAYAVMLAPGMLAAFALGPLLGIAWAQGMFTLVVASAFAQIAPASWELAGARILDIVTGSVIGLLCGLLAWPAGARREVRRTMAALLRCCGPLVTGTADVLLAPRRGAASPPSTLPTLHRLRLAEAAYAQYRSEPAATPAAARADWQAVLIAANHVLIGAQWLPRFDLPVVTVPPAAAAWAREAAAHVAATADRIAALATDDRRSPRAPDPPFTTPDDAPPLPALIDLETWLRSLNAQLGRIEDSLRDMEHATDPATVRPGGQGSEGAPHA
ncbi:FUSC family protein [Streptomyces formicae]|uniref:FUSC family protein n=1 Tax=Streptomyces formicae TaxID=1616117 RepID=A0ABY3WKD4_9ACTN|nr:FUSC family protein [Streptomyces formicae]UNM12071.1 FUSC family protein [Streptomyces formicae]